jgi:hypothetical protein
MPRSASLRRASLLALLALAACAAPAVAPPTSPASPAPSAQPGVAGATAAYFPPPGDGWQRRRPADVGMDSIALAAAVAHARASEIGWHADMSVQVTRNFPN